MNNEIKRKRGRPKTGGDIRDIDIHLRMSNSEVEKLDRFIRITGKSRADFIRDAIDAAEELVERERADRFAYLKRDSDDDYGYFEEYEEDFDDDFSRYPGI